MIPILFMVLVTHYFFLWRSRRSRFFLLCLAIFLRRFFLKFGIPFSVSIDDLAQGILDDPFRSRLLQFRNERPHHLLIQNRFDGKPPSGT